MRATCCGICDQNFLRNFSSILSTFFWHKRGLSWLIFFHYRCCICRRESTTLVALRAHLRVHESQRMNRDKPNLCKECNKSFHGKHHLNRHMKLIHGIGKYKITEWDWTKIDGKTFTFPDVPRTKQNSNSIPPDSSSIRTFFDMQCEICKTELSSLQHAKLHYLEQHDIPDGYIKCCEMKFREVKNINDHLRYHLNPNIFKYDFESIWIFGFG